jgi:hypothetical protein
MLGWLIAPIITSIVASILIVKVWDTLFGGVTNSFLGVARAGLFVGTWATITTAAGMRGVNGMTRRLSSSALLRRLRTLAGSGRS